MESEIIFLLGRLWTYEKILQGERGSKIFCLSGGDDIFFWNSPKSRGNNSAPMFSCPYCKNTEESMKHFLPECKHFQAQCHALIKKLADHNLNLNGLSQDGKISILLTNSAIVTYIRYIFIYETRRQTQQD